MYDDAFLASATISLELVARPSVPGRWAEPSALPGLTIGALACHLGRQTVRAAQLLPRPATLPRLDSVDEHYARASWVVTGANADNDEIDRAEARLGHDALLTRTAEGLDTCRRLLSGPDRPDTVDIPWQGWSLRRADFLLTRMIEIVVHSADLAAGPGEPAPEFPDVVTSAVIAPLSRLAVGRHGAIAVVEAFTRAERARPVNAF